MVSLLIALLILSVLNMGSISLLGVQQLIFSWFKSFQFILRQAVLNDSSLLNTFTARSGCDHFVGKGRGE